MTQQIVEQTQTTALDNPIQNMIQQAIQSGASVETMERLFQLYTNMKGEKAKEEYVKALAQFQSQCPVIEKKKKVNGKDGKLRYTYAPLEDIIQQIKKPLADNGLSYSWDIQHENNHMIATVSITHTMGHTEKSTFEIPIDPNQYMTSPQRYASAQTYAKRYTLTNALGISTADEDTDAVDVNTEKNAKSVKSQIVFLLKQLGEDVKTKESITKAVKAKTNLSLIEKNYEEIVTRLEVIINEQSYEDSKV